MRKIEHIGIAVKSLEVSNFGKERLRKEREVRTELLFEVVVLVLKVFLVERLSDLGISGILAFGLPIAIACTVPHFVA